jgi:hypothetical protein
MHKSSAAPIKFVPLSDQKLFTFPLMLENRRNALMNAEELKEFTTSIRTVRTTRHVNKTAQRLDEALPPLVCLAKICQGPKTSTPTIVKRGASSSFPSGRSAIF